MRLFKSPCVYGLIMGLAVTCWPASVLADDPSKVLIPADVSIMVDTPSGQLLATPGGELTIPVGCGGSIEGEIKVPKTISPQDYDLKIWSPNSDWRASATTRFNGHPAFHFQLLTDVQAAQVVRVNFVFVDRSNAQPLESSPFSFSIDTQSSHDCSGYQRSHGALMGLLFTVTGLFCLWRGRRWKEAKTKIGLPDRLNPWRSFGWLLVAIGMMYLFALIILADRGS